MLLPVMHERNRGQLLPMWALGIIATFALMFLALNYGNAIRWQIRAQNAADSAAAAVVGIQAQRWNVMTATLYASAVEEYRIRRVLDSLLYTIDQSGGCVGTFDTTNPLYTSQAFGSCNRTYSDLRTSYLRAVNRYGNDVNDLNNVATLSTYTTFTNDASNVLTQLQACSTVISAASPAPSPTAAATPAPAASVSPTCGDTSFKYSFANGTNNGIAQQTNLNNVTQDAQQWLVSYGGATTGTYATINASLFAPVKVDIVTCAVVPAIVPNFGPIHFPPYYAVGRAAAANVMIEQDWLQPGTIVDPQRGSLFQPDEPNTPAVSPTPSYNWYDVNFGGETNTAYVNSGVFGFQFGNDDFEAQVGWWGSIPIRPFGGTISLTGPSGSC